MRSWWFSLIVVVSDEHGNIIYANEAYRNLVPGSRDASKPEPWWEMIPEDQIPRAKEAYRQLMVDHVKVTFELAFRKFAKTSDAPTDEFRWMLVSAYPALHEDGRVKYITGCMADINNLKLAEQVQGARAFDALESKRKLEHFIDMTSHEMRNPLSAIVHSAEEILSSLRNENPQELTKATIADAVEAAEIIIYCADHSTRIVDDILLVSKLESGLLTINPTVVQPVNAIKQALKMFDGEMRAADIKRSFTVDDSINSLHVDWVSLDISRVLQVFVNLITNAIKFTRPENVRQVSTHVKAFSERPSSASLDNGFPYLQPQVGPSTATEGDDTIYVSITVSDTGCGLTEAEQKNLFLRFSQAGKRTHVKYGGTGLGLFISRQLCEMQGGQIGLESTPKKGSTFSFYVAAHRAQPPELASRRSSSTDCLPKPAPGLPTSVEAHRKQSIDVKRTTTSPINPPPTNLTEIQSNENQRTSQSSTAPVASERPLSSRVGVEMSPAVSQPQTILLVEDNLVNQKVVAKKLRTQGYTVLVANHGLEALDRISESALWSGKNVSAALISLILLDMEMPVMDGLSCIRRIRESEKLGHIGCHVPVIAVTANARQEQIEQAKEAGMVSCPIRVLKIGRLTSIIGRCCHQTLPYEPAVRNHLTAHSEVPSGRTCAVLTVPLTRLYSKISKEVKAS